MGARDSGHARVETVTGALADDRICHAVQRAELPAELVGDLRGLISNVHTPLAVRSSSLLEDDLAHPFAGVYGTKMIPNNQIEEDARFECLDEAIKFVFATTFFSEAQAYLASIGRSPGNEKMAVVGTFASGLAHEVRNPLNSIALQLSILERRVAPLPPGVAGEIRELVGVRA